MDRYFSVPNSNNNNNNNYNATETRVSQGSVTRECVLYMFVLSYFRLLTNEIKKKRKVSEKVTRSDLFNPTLA